MGPSPSSYDKSNGASCTVKVIHEHIHKNTQKPLFPNPDPNNYDIIYAKQIKNFLLIQIHYPDCINYEGIKILIYKDITLSDLKKQDSIDPHFSRNKRFKSPIARFVPSVEGLKMAISFCKNYK